MARYSRGVDRQEADLVLSSYWPDGWDDHGVFEGAPEAFVGTFRSIWPTIKMQHMLGQSYIEIKGKFANTETYFIAYHRVQGKDGTSDMFTSGRYVDRFEKRGNEWRLLHR